MQSCASLGSLSFLPIVICQHEVQALAMEALIIRVLAPSANRVDQIQASARDGNGVLLKPTKVAERRRPFPRFRAAHGAALSIWTVPHFIDIAQRELDHPTAAPAMEDCRHIRGSFSLLYWGNQRHVLIERAEHGPISIFTPGYIILLLATLPLQNHASFCHRPGIDQHGHGFLYEAGEALEKGVMSNSKRFLAARTIGYLLMRNPLPPLQVPPLKVHPMFRRRIGVIRRAVYRSLQQFRNAYSRMWIVARLRVHCGPFSHHGVWDDGRRRPTCSSKPLGKADNGPGSASCLPVRVGP
jgi:hypothetical protein